MLKLFVMLLSLLVLVLGLVLGLVSLLLLNVDAVVCFDVDFLGVVNVASCRDRLRNRKQWRVDGIGFSVL